MRGYVDVRRDKMANLACISCGVMGPKHKDWCPLLKHEAGQKTKNVGWVCPRCGRVNAPWVSSCSCNS